MVFSLVLSTSCCERFKFANVRRTSKLRNGKREQRFVIKCFWMRGLVRSAIDQELQHTPGSTADSEESVENWVRRFVSGDTSCADLPGWKAAD
jgi:hypothetical protein